MENNFNIIEAFQKKFTHAMSTLPTVIGNEVVNFSKERFNEQGWKDRALEPWQKRKSNKDTGRAILVKTGRLKRSIRIVNTTNDSVTIGSDVPYAQVHNDGFEGDVSVRGYKRNKYSSRKVGSGKTNKSGSERIQTVKGVSGSSDVKGYTRHMNMPRRRFLGNSQLMMAKLRRVAINHLLKNTFNA